MEWYDSGVARDEIIPQIDSDAEIAESLQRISDAASLAYPLPREILRGVATKLHQGSESVLKGLEDASLDKETSDLIGRIYLENAVSFALWGIHNSDASQLQYGGKLFEDARSFIKNGGRRGSAIRFLIQRGDISYYRSITSPGKQAELMTAAKIDYDTAKKLSEVGRLPAARSLFSLARWYAACGKMLDLAYTTAEIERVLSEANGSGDPSITLALRSLNQNRAEGIQKGFVHMPSTRELQTLQTTLNGAA